MPKSSTDRILLALLAVAVVGFLFVIKDLFVQRVVQAGDTAPEFTVTTNQGRVVKTTDFGGKLLVLNFWATWCPPCVEETPSLNHFAQAMQKDGVVVLGVSIDKNEQAYRRFVEQMRVAFPTALDPSTLR